MSRSDGLSPGMIPLPSAVRWLLAGVLGLLPTMMLLGPWGAPLATPALKALLLLLGAFGAAALLPAGRTGLPARLLLSALLSASLFAIATRLVLVSDFPFKLGWSEGNRLWDYSLYFRWGQYGFPEGTAFPTYLTPGRHGLWGLPFLLPRLPIWGARLWDALLWIVPYLLLGWLLVRRFGTRLPRLTGLALAAWVFLFLNLGGIFASLIVSAILVVWLHDPRNTARTMLIAALAGLYAGLSRWTWLLAPAAWAVLLVLLSPERRWSNTERLKQGAAVGLAGALGGLASQWVMAQAFPRPDPVFSTAASQPLLWYRLLPSPTNPIGILPGLLIGVGPILALLAWAIRRARVPWTRLEQGFAALMLAVLFVASLVASAKIGGGSNLHNADMLLLTVLILITMAGGWMLRDRQDWWPALRAGWRAVAILALLIPAFVAVWTGGPLRLPSEAVTRGALATIEQQAEQAAHEGPVLFIDQRQLFTFGKITEVPLVMDYELKDMMNQALSANEAYFEQFRADLQRHRFSLIVSDPLPSSLQGRGHQFGEENDAWLTYVAEPLRAHYEPYLMLDEIGAWLLRPRADGQ